MEEPKAGSGRWLERWSRTLIQLGSGRNIIILLLILVVFSLGILGPAYNRIAALSGGMGAIDLLIVYSPDKAYEIMGAYGEKGRRYYATIALTLDSLFPPLLALTFSTILASLFRQTFSREGVQQRALFVPLAAMTADVLENIGIVTMLLNYPRNLPAAALLASTCSTVKWTAVTAEAVLVIIGLTAWLIQRVRQTRE